MEKKQKKMLSKVREERQQSKNENKSQKQGRSFGDKAMMKIQAASRPTRSKMIVKSPKLGGGGKKKHFRK